MNFNSSSFLFFFPAVVLLFALVRGRRVPRDLCLLATSYFFYMSWNWKYAGLIAFSTLVDYFVARVMGRQTNPRKRMALLCLSLSTNLGLLGLFKYFNFFARSAAEASEIFGLNLSAAHVDLLLPVGISFYTFQTLSYTIDVYRGAIPVERNLLRFAVFVSFFPQLVAGPIVRASAFLPQLRAGPQISPSRFDDGMALIFRGLFKKIVIADLLATLGVDAVFSDPTSFSSWDLLFALYGYSFQIYNDFSGYSDIAIGAAKILGYDIPDNFNRPYLSQNVREFWTRWHISLSSWLRDYLYISLGGNRKSNFRTRVNLLLTMLLGGLWHGAAMNFVLWGGYHGLLLVLAGRGAERTPHRSGWSTAWRRVGCFHLVVFGWLLFRVTSMENFVDYGLGLLQFSGGTRLNLSFYAVLTLAAVAHCLDWNRFEVWRSRFFALPLPLQAVVFGGLILGFCGATLGAPSFIYFQF